METKRVHEIVHGLRQKPQHVRENVAIGVAGGTTLLVAFGWFIAMGASGSFSLAPSKTIASDTEAAPTSVVSKDSFSNLLGAAGAAMGAAATTTSGVTIVDTKTSSTLEQPAIAPDVTVIHF